MPGKSGHTKYSLKPPAQLRTIKEMLNHLGLNLDHVLGDWLINHRCKGSLIQEMPLPLEDHIFLIKGMFASAGHDLDQCLEGWRYKFRKKRGYKVEEKLNLKQTEIMKKWNSFDKKALGIGLIDHRGKI